MEEASVGVGSRAQGKSAGYLKSLKKTNMAAFLDNLYA